MLKCTLHRQLTGMQKLVIGISTEKMNGASFTRYNTKAGDLLTLKMKGANGAISLGTPDPQKTHKLFYCLHYDAVLQVHDTGVSVLE